MSKSTTQPKALIFDVGDILYDASVWRKWLTNELNRVGVTISYDRLVEDWERLLIPVYKGQADYWAVFDGLLKSYDLEPAVRNSLTTAAREKGKSVQVDRQPMPGVPETLQALQEKGVNLVALSDSESGEAGIRKTLNQLGIEQYFDAVVSSFAIGHVKPEPEAFDFAVKQTGFPKSKCGFVAHDIDELEGAQRYGLLAIAYNYHRDAPADFYLQHFQELIDLTH
jgi:HAD superfamily hydrolase (TIGR01509 family)